MTNVADIAQAVAVVVACISVISGIGAWKREFVGKRRIELAEEVLAKFFEVKDAVAHIRNPWSRTDEGKSREREENETEEEAKLLDRGYVVVERYQTRESVFAEFNRLKYRFMASFGPETEPIFTETFKAVNSIFISARMLATHYWKDRSSPREPEAYDRYLKELRENESVFWDRNDEEDVIRQKLGSAQAQLEAATAPCFEEPSTLYAVLSKKLSVGGSQGR